MFLSEICCHKRISNKAASIEGLFRVPFFASGTAFVPDAGTEKAMEVYSYHKTNLFFTGWFS